MSRLRIKFCGMTHPDDVDFAARLGVDAIGMVFYPPAKSHVEIAAAADIVGALPPFVDAVALFVNPSSDEVRAVLDAVRPQFLQFHGDEEAGFCESFAMPYIKACRVREDKDIQKTQGAHPNAAGILADSYDKKEAGGSGRTFDWNLLPPPEASPNLVVAGGLNADNVNEAVSRLHPWGVDVSSGISLPDNRRRKSQDKMHHFFRAAIAASNPQEL